MRFEIKASLLLFSLYLILGLMQIPSYMKIDSAATLTDSLVVVVLFAALLLPAAHFGARLAPEHLPIFKHLVLREKGTAREIALKLIPALILGFLAFVVNAFLTGVFGRLGIPPTTPDYVLRFTVIDKIVTSISSGIWEETIFRLFLISAIFMIIRHKATAAIVANLFFTLLHVVLQQTPYNATALLIVFIIGLIYTKTYWDHGLGSAATCHAAMNLLSMTLGPLL